MILTVSAQEIKHYFHVFGHRQHVHITL